MGTGCVCVCVCVCVCIVALVIQQAKPMCRIILSSVCCPALPYFATLSHNRYNFLKKKRHLTESEFFYFHYKYIGPHLRYLFFLSDFKEASIFSAYFQKITKYKISWKSAQWKQGCSMRTDRQT